FQIALLLEQFAHHVVRAWARTLKFSKSSIELRFSFPISIVAQENLSDIAMGIGRWSDILHDMLAQRLERLSIFVFELVAVGEDERRWRGIVGSGQNYFPQKPHDSPNEFPAL